MITLAQIIFIRWLADNIKDLPKEIREYWSYRDELTVENGIILKGQAGLIPKQLQSNSLQQLHLTHQGNDTTRRLA